MAAKKTRKAGGPQQARKAETKKRKDEKASTQPAGEPKAARSPKAQKVGKKLSALDAAAKVLAESGQPMTCREMIATMVAKGYWLSPGGATPYASLSSAILRELQAKGAAARFKKTDRGKFAVAK